jgi:hypothetical protein
MSEAAFAQLSGQIDMLSYTERVMLLDKIVSTLRSPFTTTVQKKEADFDAAFGLWKDRNISVEAIRQKAWGR